MPRATRSKALLIGLLSLLSGLTAQPAHGHEVQAQRLSLVLREPHHLSLIFYLDYADWLHRALAPQRPMAEFLLTLSAAGEAELAAALLRAHAKLQAGTRLKSAEGQVLHITQWRWPSNSQVLEHLQRRAMQLMVAPQDHGHEPPLELQAELASASAAITGVQLQLPAELGRVLVVSYRPSQRWLEPGAPATSISF